jgi:hypothetical protein
MPSTLATPARCAGEEAANGGYFDHDHGTKWEGLVYELPRFRPSPFARLAHSGRYELHARKASALSPAAEKAKRRNARKLDRRFGPKGRGRAGMLGLLDAIKAPDTSDTPEPRPAA